MRVLERTKRRIIDAGFSHIKLELEAQLDRNDYGDHENCDDCEDGRVECSECNGSGAIYDGETNSGHELWSECSECYGDGDESCNYCSGSGRVATEGQDDDWCESFILNAVSTEARNALTYGKFYNDGSVDSEYTFTLPVEKSEYLVEYIDAFKALADEIGNGLDTEGAGMHISVIPTESNGYYPSRVSLDAAKIAHFKREVTKLLPALYFVATATKVSRDLSYRMPFISEDKHNRGGYPAICTHSDTSLEYRIFDTCYDKPEAIFEFMEVIANTLGYYADTTKTVPKLEKKFVFETYGQELQRFYKTPENLRVLNSTIKYVKPAQKSFKALKEERGFKHTIGSLNVAGKRTIKRLQAEYEQLKEQTNERRNQPFDAWEESQVLDQMRYNGLSREAAEDEVRGTNVPAFADFVNDNIFRRGHTLEV